MSATTRLGQLAGVAVVVTSLFLVVLVGTGGGAPAQLLPGPTEVGGGADVGEQGLAYWVWEATQVWTVPAVIPPALSTSAATPTRLPPASSTFTINPATAGAAAVRWQFQETQAAPVSTELELRFLDGLSGPAVGQTVYLETQAVPPAGTLVFYLLWDAGTVSPSSITIETMQAAVAACPAVGNCP